MKKILIALFVFTTCGAAAAAPVTFNSAAYTVSAYAQAGAVTDGPYFDTDEASPFPLIAAAGANDAGNLANASAVADAFFLFGSSDAFGLADAADASATATFTGRFHALPGNFFVDLDFDTGGTYLADALSESRLRITLEAGGLNLLDEILAANTRFFRSFTLPFAADGLLDITLISSASASTGESAFNQASASFSLNRVPEPSGLALLLAGMGGMQLLSFLRADRAQPPARARARLR